VEVLIRYNNLNKPYGIFLAFGFIVFLLVGCSTASCRLQEAENMQKATEKVATVSTVKVYKYDGSLQCGMGKSIALVDMQVELKNIKVFTAVHKNDGLMRIQLCGSPTGDANVFEISRDDLEKALALNFREWTFD
jgi:flavin-binding protein dodecin